MKNIKILPVTIKDFKEKNIECVGCPSLVIPFLNKNYYPVFIWGKTKEEIIEKVKNQNPLIIFSKFDKIPSKEKIPTEFHNQNEVYFMRYWNTITNEDWKIIKSNLIETETHNFLSNWDLSNCYDRDFEIQKQRNKMIEERVKELTKREIEEMYILTKKKITI